ncbi:chloride channel protein [Niabella insulamsoli]|uniref:chloride channel protein n=1 Tax=Niabella insulamsoli TaxID=3144874 RepID=UPI0031FD4935
MERKKIIQHNYFKLILIAALIGAISCLLAFSLKHFTEYLEHSIFTAAAGISNMLFIVLPTIGITAIYFLRKYLFQNRKNKGITEIYKTLDLRKEHLPFFKIPSHYLNGFLTVIFGGSTGVEVSTVVATATIGNMGYKREFSAKIYKTELVCAGVTAGVAVLFASPLAGWLFAMEVIARKLNKSLAISCTASAVVAAVFIYFFDHSSLLSFAIGEWHWQALPFFILLGLLGGTLSVYFTLLVTRIKSLFAKIQNNFIRVNMGALVVGTMIMFYPALYGDSYHGLETILDAAVSEESISLMLLLMLALLKPLAASLTLGAGGDGGVFAPGIVAGAFLGLLFSAVCNQYFGTHLVPLNFALVGAAATLSSAIFAPLTALVLVCNLVPNGYQLLIPVTVGCFTSKFFSQKLLPYNAYTYDFYKMSKAG